jgi:hypothetical protein
MHEVKNQADPRPGTDLERQSSLSPNRRTRQGSAACEPTVPKAHQKGLECSSPCFSILCGISKTLTWPLAWAWLVAQVSNLGKRKAKRFTIIRQTIPSISFNIQPLLTSLENIATHAHIFRQPNGKA